MYINSPGGVVTSGMAIYDTMQFIRPPVSTLCIGQAASMGSLLLAAGDKDLRFALPNARIMVHQPSGGFQGQATDIMLHAQEILNLKKRLNEIYVKHTGQPLKKIEDALERDTFLTAEMAQGLRHHRQGDREAAGGAWRSSRSRTSVIEAYGTANRMPLGCDRRHSPWPFPRLNPRGNSRREAAFWRGTCRITVGFVIVNEFLIVRPLACFALRLGQLSVSRCVHDKADVLGIRADIDRFVKRQ